MADKVNPVPVGANPASPYLSVSNAAEMIDFYKRALGATERYRLLMPDGKIGHAEINIGAATIMLADEFSEMGLLSPKSQGIARSPVAIHLYVEDVDAVYNRAVEAGATSVRAPETEFFGERNAHLTDPSGHLWFISSQVENVTPEEMQRRLDTAISQEGETSTAQENIAAPANPPPSLLLYQMSIGHYVSRALALAAKLQIADLLRDGPRNSGELAEATGMHAESLNRVMRLLASAGVFTEQENLKFSLTSLGELLRSDVPGSMRAPVMLFAGIGIQEAWAELEYCVRTGEPAFRRISPDADAFTQMAKDPEMARMFDEAMASFAPITSAAIVAAYDFSPFRTLVDVGGGNGAILIGILKANPTLRGIVFDQPHAAQTAVKKIAEAGLKSRCEAVGGDFFKDVPSGADAYISKHVIHDWNDERAIAILKNCRRAMGSQAKLLIAEGVYPPRIDQSDLSRGAAANDVNMLVSTGGRQR